MCTRMTGTLPFPAALLGGAEPVSNAVRRVSIAMTWALIPPTSFETVEISSDRPFIKPLITTLVSKAALSESNCHFLVSWSRSAPA